MEPFHLTKYIDEQVFRFNNRATKDNPLNDSDRFTLAMSQVAGRRLTYADLTGKNESPRHVPTGTGETQQATLLVLVGAFRFADARCSFGVRFFNAFTIFP